MKQIIENLAIVIYCSQVGMEIEEYNIFMGNNMKEWIDLTEWEKDEFRFQATKVVKYLMTGKYK